MEYGWIGLVCGNHRDVQDRWTLKKINEKETQFFSKRAQYKELFESRKTGYKALQELVFQMLENQRETSRTNIQSLLSSMRRRIEGEAHATR